MDVLYNGKPIINGQFIKVSEAQVKPEIVIKNANDGIFYTIIMHDPDAVGGNKIHWSRTNIKGNSGSDIIPYVGPAPPPKTGKHHYIFELYKQNGENIIDPIDHRQFDTSELRNKLNLSNPIFTIEFISQNESGGKKSYRRKRRKNKKTRKNRRRNALRFLK